MFEKLMGMGIVYFDLFLYVFMAPKIITRSFAIKLSNMVLKTGRPIIILSVTADRTVFQLRVKRITLLLCQERERMVATSPFCGFKFILLYVYN